MRLGTLAVLAVLAAVSAAAAPTRTTDPKAAAIQADYDDSSTRPKQVDSTSFGGPDKGQVSLGIYEILDAKNKRACWAKPGKPRPTSFDSTPGSGSTVQDWRLISKDLGR